MTEQVRKYTDRDVRESKRLRKAVRKYLKKYEGDFEFLLDCKRRLEEGTDLTIGQYRGAANCMWTDPRVRNMPTPGGFGGTVIDFPDLTTRKRRKSSARQVCPLLRAGIYHHHKKSLPWNDYEYCAGLHRINRETWGLTTPADVHAPYVAATMGSCVHKTNGGRVLWFPLEHEYGWAKPPRLQVATLCGYPRQIDRPRLLDSPDNVPDNRSGKINRGVLPLCKRCFPIHDV